MITNAYWVFFYVLIVKLNNPNGLLSTNTVSIGLLLERIVPAGSQRIPLRYRDFNAVLKLIGFIIHLSHSMKIIVGLYIPLSNVQIFTNIHET